MLDLQGFVMSNDNDVVSLTGGIVTTNYTKSDLLTQVSGNSGVTKADAEKVIDAFFDATTMAARGGDSVSWPGFGKFSRSDRAARMGRNPQTGAPVSIPASSAMKFSSAKALKEAMNR